MDAISSGSGSSDALRDVLPPHLRHLYVLSPTEHRTDKIRRLIHALGSERALIFVSEQRHAMVTKYKLEARNLEVRKGDGWETVQRRGAGVCVRPCLRVRGCVRFCVRVCVRVVCVRARACVCEQAERGMLKGCVGRAG